MIAKKLWREGIQRFTGFQPRSASRARLENFNKSRSFVAGVLKAKYFLDEIFFEGSSRVNFLLYLEKHHGGQSCAKHGTPLEDWGWLDF